MTERVPDLPARCGVCYGGGWTICVDDQRRIVCFSCHGTGLAPTEAKRHEEAVTARATR